MQITELQKERLEIELDKLKKSHSELIDKLPEALSHGDKSENAELDSLKQEIAVIGVKIHEMESILTDADVVKLSDGDSIVVGSLITISRKLPNGDYSEPELLVVDSVEKPFEGTLGVQSPLGKEILGNPSGEFTVQTSFGDIQTYRVEVQPSSRAKELSNNYMSIEEIFKDV